MAAISRAISIFEGAFSSRDIVGCEHKGSPALRQPAHRHLEDRIVSQRVAIVGVLVARRDREHPKPEHLLDRMQNPVRIAPVSQARCQTRRNSQPLLDPPQQKHARVR